MHSTSNVRSLYFQSGRCISNVRSLYRQSQSTVPPTLDRSTSKVTTQRPQSQTHCSAKTDSKMLHVSVPWGSVCWKMASPKLVSTVRSVSCSSFALKAASAWHCLFTTTQPTDSNFQSSRCWFRISMLGMGVVVVVVVVGGERVFMSTDS